MIQAQIDAFYDEYGAYLDNIEEATVVYALLLAGKMSWISLTVKGGDISRSVMVDAGDPPEDGWRLN